LYYIKSCDFLYFSITAVNLQVSVPSGKSITFREAREKFQKVASALTKMGFKKGDILLFVTSECVDLYLVLLAVWKLGGAVRGTCAIESKGIYN